jgi:diguanylate cyclase (GGDEF)-like protein
MGRLRLVMIRIGLHLLAKCGTHVVVCFALLCMLTLSSKADGVVNITAKMQVQDLTEHGTRVAAQRRNLALEVPGTTDGSRGVLELRGTGPGPEFNWTVYTIRNAGAEAREYVLAIDAQRLAASGIVKLLPFGAPLQSVQWMQASQPATLQSSTTAVAYRFELKPGEAMTAGVEGGVEVRGAKIYDFRAFTQREATFSFLRGAAMAVGFVLALSILALYGIRTNRAFLVGGFFAFTALVFMALESGYLDSLSTVSDLALLSLQHIRAYSESLLALGVGVLFWGLTSLYRRNLRGELPYLLLVLSLVALIGLSAYMPEYATKVARWAILALAIAGFVSSVAAGRKGVESIDNVILFWSALLLWAFIAAMAVTGDSYAPVWHAAILAGLTAVVGILAFVSLRLAFAQGFMSKPYLQDSSRRSLALTGAQHFLWDWQPQEGVLDVGLELASGLGHATEKLRSTTAKRWFAALLHPSDELAYQKTLDLRGLNPGSFIEQELRLRDAKGTYHWYSLRARSLAGAGGTSARLIGTLTDISRNKQTEDRLINESIHDPVTGLPSRALFMDRLEQDIVKPLALPRNILMVGIERFKILNEGLGHDLGDQLLLQAGQRIAKLLKADESVSRISGSRFAILHVETIDGRPVEKLAEDIVDSLALPFRMLSQEIYLSACVGISLRSDSGGSALELQQQAERALHEAQAQGPRSIALFHDEITDERADNVALESDLRRAIERHEIEVHYQPIVNLLTREVAGFEALARWQHPTRGLLQPSEFIGMAEQAGMIREIGDLVLAEAIRQMGIWQRVLTRNRPVFMAVNVSSDQLSDTGFLDRLNAIIAREGVLPYAIKIEITESVAMRFPERARQLIQRLVGLGIGVACDDFGTGFSNLSGLRELAFDTLKMDRSFIAGDGMQNRGGVILQSVVNMAHSLGMVVVAEGIESEEQAQHLLLMGCELGQGYALAPPMTPRDIHSLLAVLPVVTATTPKPVMPAVGAAPLAPRLNYADDDIDAEPEELPSLYSVYTPKPAKKKPKKKPVPTKAKAKVVKKPAKAVKSKKAQKAKRR